MPLNCNQSNLSFTSVHVCELLTWYIGCLLTAVVAKGLEIFITDLCSLHNVVGSCLPESWSFKSHHSWLRSQGICTATWKCFLVEKVEWRWQWSDVAWSCSIFTEWVFI